MGFTKEKEKLGDPTGMKGLVHPFPVVHVQYHKCRGHTENHSLSINIQGQSRRGTKVACAVLHLGNFSYKGQRKFFRSWDGWPRTNEKLWAQRTSRSQAGAVRLPSPPLQLEAATCPLPPPRVDGKKEKNAQYGPHGTQSSLLSPTHSLEDLPHRPLTRYSCSAFPDYAEGAPAYSAR